MPAIALFLTAPSRFFFSRSLIRSAGNAKKVTLILLASFAPLQMEVHIWRGASPACTGASGTDERSVLSAVEGARGEALAGTSRSSVVPRNDYCLSQSSLSNQQSRINNYQWNYSFLIRFYRITNTGNGLQH